MFLVPASSLLALLLCLVCGGADSSITYTLSNQLVHALPWLGGKLVVVPPNTALLGPTEAGPIQVNASLTLRGDASGAGSLDAQYASQALSVAPGAQLVIDTLRLYNVRMDTFMSLAAFNANKLRLTSLEISTDCLTLSTISKTGNPSATVDSVQGPGYLYVSSYTSVNVNATAVNITCSLPAVQPSNVGDYVEVADSTGLFNALFANLSSTVPLTVMAKANLSLSPALWQLPRMVVLARNVSLRGDPARLNVLDLAGIVFALRLSPTATFEIANFWVINLSQLRGVLVQASILPLFSFPIWFFLSLRSPLTPQLRLTNVILTLPPAEYFYFTMWTVVVTTEVAQVSEAAATLRATTSVVKVGVAINKDSITFAQMRGTGLDMYNSSFTAAMPSGPFTNTVLDNPNLQFSLGVTPNVTQLPVYSLADLMAVLQALQTAPLPGTTATALFILRNITLDAAVWPADGYNVSSPLVLVGAGNLGVTTWIDFRRLPRFVRTFGCPVNMYVYLQGLHLVNLPNAMDQPPGLPSGAAPIGSVESAGMGDVSMYMSNIVAVNTTCPTPVVYINQSTMTITYAEYKRVYAQVAKSLGTTGDGQGSAIGSNFTYKILSVVSDEIRFQTVLGWGWSGYKLNLTYNCPGGVSSMYANVYDPPSPPPQLPAPVAVPVPPSGHGAELRGWHVALIVLGAVALVALVTGLIAWRIVSRLRREVDAVKSGSSDKRSSAPSADTEAAAAAAAAAAAGGGSRLGSSGTGNTVGGEPGAPASPGAVKAGMLGEGADGAAGSGSVAQGTSDGSAHPGEVAKPPLEVLNSMMTTLTREMNDQHLTILEVIGQGGFGVVYKGQWKGLNVAVKTITFQDRVAGGEKAQHRAILEAAISSSLAHPNVVTTYSYDIKPLTVQDSSSNDSPGNSSIGTPGGLRIIDRRTVLDWKLYLIQEYCDGGSLRTAILKRKFFDSKRGEPRMEMLLDTALELAGGLVHLHERNIIHGDLNPNNVLLKRDASRKYGAICKIADFGLSIRMNADQSHISNMRRGTPFYTCPQILSRGNMTKAADVYSMGVIMWEMYHCCMSYRSLPSGFAARENFPAFPRKAPHDFAQLVASCLDPEPAARPTFLQLRAALESQLAALKRGELRSGEAVLGPDPAGDAAHMAACQD